MARPPAIEEDLQIPLALNMRDVRLTDDQFAHLCSDNRDIHFEMTAQGELLIMPPAYSETGWRNAKITQHLGNWTDRDGTGLSFDSSAIFKLPNGAKRAPDGAWISKSRWRELPKEDRRKFAPICPDFVIELRSASDRLRDVRKKMEEYMSNGARLGWLLDPLENCATIYLPGKAPERVESPAILSGDPVLPGFRFDFREILNSPE